MRSSVMVPYSDGPVAKAVTSLEFHNALGE